MPLREAGLPPGTNSTRPPRGRFLCQPSYTAKAVTRQQPTRGWLHWRRIAPHKPDAHIFSGHQ